MKSALLQAALDEKNEADEKLTELAMSEINPEAEAANEEELLLVGDGTSAMTKVVATFLLLLGGHTWL